MTTWYECSTLAEPEAVDAVAEVFGSIGQGVAIEQPVVSSPDGEQVRIEHDKPVVVKTYLPHDERTEERRRRLEEAIWHLGRLRQVEPLQVKTLLETDWADAWKKHFFVHRVGERLVIVPSWRRHRRRPGDLPIQLDPGMAFGTGLHPTTRLCLRALETYVRGGETVLDLGTGSGILAIAAAKLGAARVLGLDVESVAVRVAAENVARNGLADAIEVREGSLPFEPPAAETFDLIVANISFRVLRELHPALQRALRPAGVALLSGVLERDAPDLLAALGAATPPIRPDEADPVGQPTSAPASQLAPSTAAAPTWRLLEQRDEAEWTLLAVSPVAPAVD